MEKPAAEGRHMPLEVRRPFIPWKRLRTTKDIPCLRVRRPSPRTPVLGASCVQLTPQRHGDVFKAQAVGGAPTGSSSSAVHAIEIPPKVAYKIGGNPIMVKL